MRVAIDVQHLFRDHKPNDRGATATLSSGLRVREGDLALSYAHSLENRLRAAGADVLSNDYRNGILVGPYSRRGRAAVAWRADVYLACHVNAGGGSYTLVEVLDEQPAALRLARAIAESVRASTAIPWAVPPITSASIRRLRRGDRGHVCLSGVNPIAPTLAILLEPYFIDTRRHEPLMTPHGAARIANAVADALEAVLEPGGRPLDVGAGGA